MGREGGEKGGGGGRAARVMHIQKGKYLGNCVCVWFHKRHDRDHSTPNKSISTSDCCCSCTAVLHRGEQYRRSYCARGYGLRVWGPAGHLRLGTAVPACQERGLSEVGSHAHTYKHIHTKICIHTHAYKHMHTHTHKHTHTHIYTHAHTHTYTG